MEKIKELQKEIENLEDRINQEYKNCPYDFDEQQQEHFKWFRTVIMPLKDKQDELNKEIYKLKLLNVAVGDGVTIGTWTDCYAYTVIKRTAKTITIQRDKAIRTDHNGMSEDQEYKYERNPEGETKVFRWSDKKNRWVHTCYKLGLGRHEYYDYSF